MKKFSHPVLETFRSCPLIDRDDCALLYLPGIRNELGIFPRQSSLMPVGRMLEVCEGCSNQALHRPMYTIRTVLTEQAGESMEMVYQARGGLIIRNPDGSPLEI